MVGRSIEKSKKSKKLQESNARNRQNRAISNRKEMVASSRMALGPIRCSCSYYELVCVGVEHGGIPYIQILIAGETYVAPTKFSRPFDTYLIERQPACTYCF